jgi:hypothetical protein
MRVMNVNWHDVFQSGRVFWGQAIYWIITKHYNGDAGDLDRAERDLIETIVREKLTLYGFDGEGVYHPIPAGVWPRATSNPQSGRPIVSYPDAEGGDLGGTVHVGSQEWKGVYVEPADLLRLWPERKRAAYIPSDEKIVEAIQRKRSRKDVKTSKGEVVKRVIEQYPGCFRKKVRDLFGPAPRGRPKNAPQASCTQYSAYSLSY